MHSAKPPEQNPYAPPNVVLEDAPVPSESEFATLHRRRNFIALTTYQIVMRSGWIFKTESIIMPAVLDLISGNAPWARQMLPLLNRVGQSLPPMLMARRVKVSPLKSRTLLSTTLVMAACFGLLGLLWVVMGGETSTTMTLIFLACYGLFFAAMGINQLVFSTTQGKLIPIRARGRMLSIANTLGAGSAIICAFLLLPHWLGEHTIDVASIFAFASGCFFLSAVATLFLVEAPDHYEQAPQTPWQHLADAWQPIREDVNFRRLAIVSATYGVSLILFPHYQAVALHDLGLKHENILWWLILQNAGVGLFSLVIGPLADRFGNRLVLRVLMLALCGAPVMSLIMSKFGREVPWLYHLVFVLVGVTPLTVKALHNYTLEICPPAEHPRYLSSISLCMAAPLLIMLPLGGFVKQHSLDLLFAVGIILMLSGWVVTFLLREPREKLPPGTSLAGELV